MLHIALFEPQIPPNTGNLIRLAANSGATLHLIKPLGFSLDEKRVKRAGLDYHALACVKLHDNYNDFVNQLGNRRLFAVETSGKLRYDKAEFQDGDVLLFGSETKGLSADLLHSIPDQRQLYIPMQPNIRSINLSNACSIAFYEAWRQLDFLV